MIRFALGASLFCVLTPGVIAQVSEVGTPPPRDQIERPPLKRGRAHGNAQQVEGAFLEEIVYTTPTQIWPDEGIGLPPGLEDYVQEDCEVPRALKPNIGPLFDAAGRDRGPVSLDRSASAPSQALMQDWEGIGPNGMTPPDPDAAAGYDYVVTATNDDFAVYDRCGNELFRVGINVYLGIDPRFSLRDPKVIFDPWFGRWVMMYRKKDSTTWEVSIVLAVTTDSIPFGLPGSGAYWYDFDAVQDAGTSDASYPDYFDLGYSNNFLTCGGNMFRFVGGFRWARIWVWDKAEIYNALPAGTVRWSNLVNADGTPTDTPRAVKMQASWSEGGANIDATWINSRGGGGTKLTQWKVRGAFSYNYLNRADIYTSAFVSPPDAVQPSGDPLDTIDCRLMTAVTTTDDLGGNGIELFTSLTTEINGVAGCRLFKIDPTTNTQEWTTTFWGGTSYHYWFACSAADYSGSNFWVFCRTGPGASAYPELRFVDYDQGLFSNSSTQITAGTGSYADFRWGDYFGGQMDWGDYTANFYTPGRPSKVWLYGEFGKAGSWGTHVGATSVFAQGVLSSVTPTSVYSIAGPQGGPFTPSFRTYTMTNNGEVGLAYEVTSLPSWLSTSSESGQLFPGTKSVTLFVNSSADSLGPGFYSDIVVFRDCFNGGRTVYRAVELVVEAPATATFRNDSGNTNPAGYWAAPPVLGTTWNASVNNGLTGNTWTNIVGFATPLSLYLGGLGDYLLVNVGDPNGELLLLSPKSGGGVVPFDAPVPNDTALMGFTFSSQGYGFGGPGPRLQNAYDLRVGI